MANKKTVKTVPPAVTTAPVLEDNGVLPGDHPSTKSKIANKIVIGALAVIGVALGIMLYWATANTQVLDIKNSPFPTRTIREHPTPDGVIILTANYCKTRDIKGTVRTSFVSQSREVLLPEAPENGPKGCQKDIEVPVIIPKNLAPDTYKIKFTVTYNINPLKKNVVQSFESQPVTIVAPGGPGSEKVAPTQ